jgi:lipid II:glycine glycyltransferase (peptidoglycan interpeptide bridge formation enzyme)
MNVQFTPVKELASSVCDILEGFSPYTSPRFLSVLEREFGEAGYFLVRSGDEVLAALPAVEIVGTGFFRRMQALVDGLPAPLWIAPDCQEDHAVVQRTVVEAISTRNLVKAVVTDFENIFEYQGATVTAQSTSLIDLSTTSRAENTYPPDNTLRSEIAKAARDGVTVVPLDYDRHMNELGRLIVQTEERHGRKSRYTGELWHGFAWLAKIDPRFRLYCVAQGNALAAAHVFIVDRDTALNWQIYFDKKFSSLKPNQAITAFAIEKFRSEGVKYLNLGATPPEAIGVLDYKKKWGGSEYRYRTLEFRSWLGRFVL